HDLAMLSRRGAAAGQPQGERTIEDLGDERRFTRARYAGHRREHADRKLRVDVAQVVLARAQDLDRALGLAARLRNFDRELPAQIAAREAAVHRRRRALIHEPASEASRTFPRSTT